MKLRWTLFWIALLTSAVFCSLRTWKISPSHGKVEFRIRHLMGASLLQGAFERFAGSIVYDPDSPANCSVRWTVDAASVQTGNASRDKHLRSQDYLNVKKFPEISFVSSGVQLVSAEQMVVTGNLTLCGVTRVITVPVVHTSDTFRAEFSVLRSDYGMTPDLVLANDDMTVSLQVRPSPEDFALHE